jgi:hypothetical protein
LSTVNVTLWGTSVSNCIPKASRRTRVAFALRQRDYFSAY